MKNAARKDYITEEEFNRIVVKRADALPEDDSKGDSARDEVFEAELGEHYGEKQFEGLDELEEGEHAPAPSDADEQKLERHTSNLSPDRSSTWPDPTEITPAE